MITEDQVQLAKDELVNLITDHIKTNKKTGPVLALIVEKNDVAKPGVLVFPLPGKLLANKESFSGILLPQIKERIIQDGGHKVHASCFIMEASMWIAKKELDEQYDEAAVKKQAPTDILLFTFEDKYGKNLIIYEVNKNSFINAEGELEAGELELNRRDDLSRGGDELVSIEGMLDGVFKFF